MKFWLVTILSHVDALSLAILLSALEEPLVGSDYRWQGYGVELVGESQDVEEETGR